MNKLAQAAAMLQQIGAQGSPDTLLAHITPQEAMMLKEMGGSGRIDPNTGLPHFEDDGSDSTSYGGTQTGGSWAGADSYSSGINSVPSGHSDPTYNSKGYYSVSGDVDGLDTRYYGFDKNGTGRTIGGDIADYFGFDPEGIGAMIGNGIVSASSMFNPMLGYAGKLAQAAVGNQTIPSPADMDGNGASPNFIGRLTGSNLLSRLTSGIQTASNDSQPRDANIRAQNQSSYSGSPGGGKAKKKPWLIENA